MMFNRNTQKMPMHGHKEKVQSQKATNSRLSHKASILLMLIYNETSPFPFIYSVELHYKISYMAHYVQHSDRGPARIVLIYSLMASYHVKFNIVTQIQVAMMSSLRPLSVTSN